MAATVIRHYYGTNHHPYVADHFESALDIMVKDGHLLVTTGRGQQTNIIATYSPGTWKSAFLDKGLTVLEGEAILS